MHEAQESTLYRVKIVWIKLRLTNMLKATVVLIVLTAIAYTSYGAPAAKASVGDAVTNAREISGLVNSRNRRALLTGQCINSLYVMAYTSDMQDGEADLRHRIRLQANGITRTKLLPDLPQDDYLTKKGDLWKLPLRRFFGFTTCIKINDIQRITILQGNNDGWNIESIVTFAVVNQSYWELTSADFNVFQWIDGNGPEAHKEFTLSLHISTGQCIHYLYIMAYTAEELDSDAHSSLKIDIDSGSDSRHQIELRVKGVTRAQLLPDLPGDDYFTSKGDLWKLSIEDDFGFIGCITKKDIQGIALLAGGNDGWRIDSVVTYVAVNEYNWELSSVDLDANRWVDDDSSYIYKRFTLNLVI